MLPLPIRRVGVCLLLAALAGCGGTPASAPEPSPTTTSPSTPSASPTPTASATPSTSPSPAVRRVRHPLVLAVSLDGFNPASLGDLGSARTPGFQRLLREGASTLDARTSYEQTHTLPNHTGMMTGLPVFGARGHGTTMNDDDGRTLAQQDGRYVPGMFDVAHDAGLRTAMYVGKDKFRFLIRSWDAGHGAPDRTGVDDGRDKIDRDAIEPDEQALDDVIADLTGARPSALTFLHLPLTDAVGHDRGFMSPAYLDAVRTVDGRLARLLDAIDAHPRLKRRLTVVVTADHGGRGPNHDDASSPDNYTIPFFVWGRGVSRGADLYALNPDRRDPGDSRPGYAGAQPVRNLDVADLCLRLLRLPALPGTGPALRTR